MAKPTSHFECTACGARSPRPMGKCGACGGFGTIEEVRGGLRKDLARSRSAFAQSSYLGPVALADVAVSDVDRRATGLAELDRVLGGGVVPGMVVLLGGEPGIGKSTLVLQWAAACAGAVLYASGEESERQIKLRARRLGAEKPDIHLYAETDVRRILDMILDCGVGGLQGFQPECGMHLDELVRRRTRDGNKLLIFGPLAVTTELPVCTPEEANPWRRWQDQS